MKPYTWRDAILKSGLRPTTRHVLLTLSCHINDVGQSAYPSTKLLAQETGLSERAVITHLHDAEKAGWLKVRKHGFGGQGWARNEYFPSVPMTEGTEASSAPKHAEGTEPNDKKALKEVQLEGEKALNVLPEGTEPHAEGTEPNDKKALKEVQSNSPKEPSKELPKELPKRAKAAPNDFDPMSALLDAGVDGQAAKDWLKVRKSKSAPLTQTALDGVVREAKKVGISLPDAVKLCAERGWQGLRAEWLAPQQARASPGANQLGKAGQITAANAQKWLEESDAGQ